MNPDPVKAAILGTGNIGTDLMFKILKQPGSLELALFAGIDPASSGIKRAQSCGVQTSASGIAAVLEDPDIRIVFDATSAAAHRVHAPLLHKAGIIAVDLTPAAIGPCCVPCVNIDEHFEADNINLITCGGQATIPMVHAVSQVTKVDYAEIVSTVSSASAGPGTRQNIDEFTVTTADGLTLLGGSNKAKALIILNPVDPPIMMHNTIYVVLEDDVDEEAVNSSIENRLREIQSYVPGYRMKGEPLYDEIEIQGDTRRYLTLLLEVTGAGDFLPEYAGNLDIMTASAWQVGQRLAQNLRSTRPNPKRA